MKVTSTMTGGYLVKLSKSEMQMITGSQEPPMVSDHAHDLGSEPQVINLQDALRAAKIPHHQVKKAMDALSDLSNALGQIRLSQVHSKIRGGAA